MKEYTTLREAIRVLGKHVKEEDVEIAKLYKESNPKLDRGALGTLLEHEGLGIGHHTHSGCADRCEYINLVLDRIPI